VKVFIRNCWSYGPLSVAVYRWDAYVKYFYIRAAQYKFLELFGPHRINVMNLGFDGGYASTIEEAIEKSELQCLGIAISKESKIVAHW
jgi:hypothetical protein